MGTLLTIGAEVAGIICGVAILVGFTIWVWRWRDHTHKSLEALRLYAAELQTQVNSLQEQVTTLEELRSSGHEKLVIKFLELRDEVKGIDKRLAEREKGWATVSIGKKPE